MTVRVHWRLRKNAMAPSTLKYECGSLVDLPLVSHMNKSGACDSPLQDLSTYFEMLCFNFSHIDIRVVVLHWEQAAARPRFERLLTFPAISSHPVPQRGDTEILCPLSCQFALGERPKAVLQPRAADAHFLPRIRKRRFKVIWGAHTNRQAMTHTYKPGSCVYSLVMDVFMLHDLFILVFPTA